MHKLLWKTKASVLHVATCLFAKCDDSQHVYESISISFGFNILRKSVFPLNTDV